MFWVDLAFELYEDSMVFRVLLFIILFLFRTNAKKGYLDENIFCHSCHSESYLITAMLKVLTQQVRGMYINSSSLQDILQFKILRTWNKIHANSFIKAWE